MIVPMQSHATLLADIEAARDDVEALHLWWLGQSGFLLQQQGKHLLFDPYLSDSLTVKYAETDKPHVRMSELVVEPKQLDFVDVVTSSHNHTDHLDAETLQPMLQANPDMQFVVPAANVEFAANRLGVDVHRLTAIDDGQSVTCSDVVLHAVPAAHESIDRDAQGRCHFVGLVAEWGDWTIYHSGDTVLYPELENRLRDWEIDVAILPINGRAPERRVAGNLWGREAAQLACDIRAGTVIPCHYDLFHFNTATPDEFVARAQQLGQPFKVLLLGERFSVNRHSA